MTTNDRMILFSLLVADAFTKCYSLYWKHKRKLYEKLFSTISA